jgi:outer membrane protein assembly factor BamB/tRNA A-37 threonylcarbamoyl transferase component Bud32
MAQYHSVPHDDLPFEAFADRQESDARSQAEQASQAGQPEVGVGNGQGPTFYPLDDVYQVYDPHGYDGNARGGDGQQGQNGHGMTGGTTESINQQVAPLMRGTQLDHGRYIVEGVLGSGGMGKVYRVIDQRLGVVRAMKEMNMRLSDPNARLVNFPREARMLMRQDHPGIPKVYDIFSNAQRSYLVMDYIEGDTLQNILYQARDAGDWLSEDQVGVWMIQLAGIVAYLHSQQPPVIFRDLKPANIMLKQNNKIVLIDFGIAKTYEAGRNHTTVGTEGFAAPEQREGKAEPRSDIYAMGAVMYNLLTGELPPNLLRSAQPRAINPNISPEMEAIILRCGEKNPALRYQTAQEFAEAVRQAIGLPSRPFAFAAEPGQAAESATGSLAYDAQPHASDEATPLWSFRAEGEIYSTPTLVVVKSSHGAYADAPSDALLLVGSNDNNMRAIDLRRRAQRWQFATNGVICGKAVVWRNMALFGSADGCLYGVNVQTGEEMWRYRTQGPIIASPRIINDRLYVGSNDGNLYAFDLPSRREMWRYPTYGKVLTTPAYGNGWIYFGASNGKLYAVDALSPTLHWTFTSQQGIFSSPAFADNHVIFGSNDHQIHCLEARSGWTAWTHSTDRLVASSPVIVDDRLYIGSGDKNLYCLDVRTGNMYWRYTTQGQIASTPAYADGVIYVGSADHRLYAIDAKTGKRIWYFEARESMSSPTVYNGVVYVGSLDWTLYALRAAKAYSF